jgi:hypothetical protein
VCCGSGWRDGWYCAWRAEKNQAAAQKAKGRLPLREIAVSSDFSEILIGIQITADCNSRIFRCFELAPSAFVFRYRRRRNSLNANNHIHHS